MLPWSLGTGGEYLDCRLLNFRYDFKVIVPLL